MARPWVWWVGIGAGTGLVAAAAWLPGYRLERELAAARAEGLWIGPSDVRRALGSPPPGENAAADIHDAIALGRERRMDEADSKSMGRLLKGAATAADAIRVRTDCVDNKDLAALWRRATEKPRLLFDRPWEDGLAVLYPEFASMKSGARLLAASAHCGFESKANLLAAARLSALTAQEPVMIAGLVSVAMGKITLREAKRRGFAREVEGALGPPIDVRRVYSFEFFDMVQTMRQVGGPDYERKMFGNERETPWRDRIRRTGPWKAGSIRRFVSLYRELWREMPRSGTDYVGAARTLERRLPQTLQAAESLDDVFDLFGSDPKGAVQFVQTIGKYEAERKAVRDEPVRPTS